MNQNLINNSMPASKTASINQSAINNNTKSSRVLPYLLIAKNNWVKQIIYSLSEIKVKNNIIFGRNIKL